MSNNRSKKQVGLRVLSSLKRYEGPVFSVFTDEVQEPTGVTAHRDVVRHTGSVVIMPVDESGPEAKVLLIRQYRYVTEQFIWEFPAGRIDPGEEMLPAAKRELVEETGFSAKTWKHAFRYYASPGFLDETMDVFYARDLLPGKARPEDNERISKRFFPLSQALRMCLTGKVLDAKTLTGVFWLAHNQTPSRPRRKANSHN